MAQAMASMTGASQQVGLGSLSSRRVSAGRAGFIVRAQQSPVESETVVQTGRRAALGLIAAGVTGGAFTQVALAAAARAIKIGGPPLPSGGLRKHHYVYALFWNDSSLILNIYYFLYFQVIIISWPLLNKKSIVHTVRTYKQINLQSQISVLK